MTGHGPIGVFDSGVGGLSTLRAIRAALPSEDLLYVADSGFAPYGDKPSEYVCDRSIAMVDFLIGQHAKAVVVACNTATSVAVDTLRLRFQVPIVALEPAIKPAVALTRTGVVGVLATTRTLSSPRFLKLVGTFSGTDVILQSCPGLVEQVEAGDLSSTNTQALIEAYVRPLVDRGADTLVLGCTHYAFLRPVIQATAGPSVTLVDSAEAVARQLSNRLDKSGLRTADQTGTEQFWTTGALNRAAAAISQLWSPGCEVKQVP
jgi:glutamate racemase